MDSLSDNNLLPKPVKNHLRNVYITIATCMLAATGGAYVNFFVQCGGKLGWLSLLISLCLLILLKVTPHDTLNRSQTIIRLELLLGFAFFTGMGCGPLIDLAVPYFTKYKIASGQQNDKAAIGIEPSIITTAFIGNFVIFLCFSLVSCLSHDLRYIYKGGLLLSALLCIPILSLIGLFIQPRLIYDSYLYSGLLIMCGFNFVLFYTQLLVVKRKMGDDDFVWHCLLLFTDWIGIIKLIIAEKNTGESDKCPNKNN